jgi:HK97 family phage prohead protease
MTAESDAYRAVAKSGLKLEEYWIHGAGAAKIAWGLSGTPGDFTRCVTHLGKYVKDPEGLCAEYHHAATGKWPGSDKGQHDAGRPGMDRAAPKPYGNVKYADPKNGKYPVDTAAHAKAAWSYINQSDNAAQYPMNGVTLAEVKSRIMAACKKFGIQVSESNSRPRLGEVREDMGNLATAAAGDLDAVALSYCAANGWSMLDGSYPIRPLHMGGEADLDAALKQVNSDLGAHDGVRRHIMRRAAAIGLTSRVPADYGNAGNTEPEEVNTAAAGDGEFRTVPFELGEVRSSGDGLNFEGYAAVYDTPTRISGYEGDFDEQIQRGAFRAVADGRYPVLMFEHGKHPLIGTMPLGRITSAREDSKGLYIGARLTDNWLIQPVRDAVADKAIKGMSFRFTVDKDGQTWQTRGRGEPRLRTLTSVSVPELGPVVFPAYEPTTASVRSLLDGFEFAGQDPTRSGLGGDRMDVQPGNGVPSLNHRQAALRRDRVARLEGII